MIIMRNYICRIVLLAGAFITIAGCDGNTGPDSIHVVQPKTGSFYELKRTSFDDKGMVRSTVTDTFHVAGVNATLQGWTGLTQFRGFGDQMGYIRYESNGDMTVFSEIDTNHDGTRDGYRPDLYPFGSHGGRVIKRDTSFDSGLPATVSVDSILYIGGQEVTVPAGTFGTSKVARITHTWSYARNGATIFEERLVDYFYLSPAVGFFVKLEHWVEAYRSGQLNTGYFSSRTELASYGLQ